ncbi:uncharacterized protein PAC_03576 [Phialocephala subalpina]|uniref:Uncharacterized protein n=1 Tax=Phialocephala subalpina TaxID=576137 RepID=A0A1L7WLR0_9HELO|nr:uncharacterized protein PAC_03576 [Phialocephala subalpina]
MPPKTVATAGAAAEGAASHNGAPVSLTSRETEMLAHVLAMMGGPPQIDYQVLANRLGIKLGRNCRAAVKKLFEKVQGTMEDVEDDEEEADTEDTPAPVKKGGKVTVKKVKATPAKKIVGKSIGPKKVVTESSNAKNVPAANKGKGKKKIKKEEDVIKTPSDEDMKEADDAESSLSELEDIDSDEADLLNSLSYSLYSTSGPS